MAWTDLTFPFASKLTSTKMTQMDDNFDALAAGANGAPEIVALTGASMVLVGAGVASSVATIELIDVFSDTYEYYLVFINSLAPATNSVSLRAQLSNDSGATWDATVNYYWSDDTAYAYFRVGGGASLINNANYNHSVVQAFTNLRSASKYALMSSVAGTRWNTTTDIAPLGSTGGKAEAGPWDSIRFYFSSGDIASGNFRVYGIKPA